MPHNLVTTHQFFTSMINFKILILGPTILPHILIFHFILVPISPLFHLFSLEKREVWVASEKHRYYKLANSIENFGKILSILKLHAGGPK